MNPRRRARRRALPQVLLRVPGCLVLVPGLLLCAAGTSSGAAAWADPVPPRMLPLPPSGARSTGVLVGARVTPATAVVGQDQNGDFTLTVTDLGTRPAYNVRVLVDGALPGNGVGSADGRCLSRLDTVSPADLWCDLGDLAPRQSVSVTVHAFMDRCAVPEPAASAATLPPAAFSWRIGYLDVDQPQTVNGPTPHWSCAGDTTDDAGRSGARAS